MILYKAIVSVESVDEILRCDHIPVVLFIMLCKVVLTS